MKQEPVAEVRVPSPERPRPETWAASTIDTSPEGRSRLFEQSKMLRERTERAIDTLGLSRHLGHYLFLTVEQRIAHENHLNYSSYENRLNEAQSADDLTLEYIGAFQRAKDSTASPDDLLIVREVNMMESVELGKLSHIGGEGIEHVKAMEGAVYSAIDHRSGIIVANPEESFNLITNDALMLGSSDGIQAITVNRKRCIGYLPCGTRIVEKSQFILRTDADSTLDPDIIDKVRRIKIEDGETWRDQILRIRGFEDVVASVFNDATQQDSTVKSPRSRFSAIIPVSTTVYAYNKEIHDGTKTREHRRRVDARLAQEAASRVVFQRAVDGSVDITPIE